MRGPWDDDNMDDYDMDDYDVDDYDWDDTEQGQTSWARWVEWEHECDEECLDPSDPDWEAYWSPSEEDELMERDR